CLLYPELPGTLAALAPGVLMIPINGRDQMRESRGIVGNMNETEAAWLVAQVAPSYAIPMHYECIEGNTGDPGRFTALVRDCHPPTAVLAPPHARSVLVTLPCPPSRPSHPGGPSHGHIHREVPGHRRGRLHRRLGRAAAARRGRTRAG